MKIFFAGTPDIAVGVLVTLIAHHEVVGVLCNPDAIVGRGRTLQSPPVKVLAQQHNLLVLQPVKLDEFFEQQVAGLGADILVCFAYGKIFKESLLALFPFGGINVHPSLLPLYRGASPLQAVLLNGDNQSGITIQRLAKKMDTGDCLQQEPFLIKKEHTLGDLLQLVKRQAPAMVIDVLAKVEQWDALAHVQDEIQATYCYPLAKDAGQLEWWSDGVEQLVNQVRAMSPEPGAYFWYGGQRLFIYRVRAEIGTPKATVGTILKIDKGQGVVIQGRDGVLYVNEFQLTGKKKLDFLSFCNGQRNFIGATLERGIK
jgi:methionyl-tRNA formyltransferase